MSERKKRESWSLMLVMEALGELCGWILSALLELLGGL
jgi:hypothetical protein